MSISARPASTASSSGSSSPHVETGATTPDERAEAGSTKLAPLSPTTDDSVYGPLLPRVPKSDDVKPLAIDAGTPDAWIPRDERLIRLTGKHPLNTEPPLIEILKTGFLTPQSLMYVRSHGAVPHVSEGAAKSWRLRVHGLVEREVSLTIDELKEKFETVTLPITMVCAGNRRKEQNMVTKGLGFNWGAAGVSTGLFTGIYLADLLEYCRPIKPIGAFPYDRDVPGRARHVIFEGIDELPKGKYGTSQRLQWARDRSKGMLIAWGINGEPLSPDHGFPLRLVVPGQIGGRMVKWLDRIEVSASESQHYLHFWDNKVLPTQVTADQARSEEHWWKDPKYIINDLNVNAAAFAPDHNETLAIAGPSAVRTYKLGGYAYTGGGKRVTRVEISLDDGRSWREAVLDLPEDKYREHPIRGHPFYGNLDLSETEMSFAWCFWELEVDVAQLAEASVISVRATDEGLASMPRDMYWNATSMMNNWWFRVAVHREGDTLRFEHPTLAGTAAGGWMERMNEEGEDPRYPVFDKTDKPAAPKAKKEKIDVTALMTDPAKLATTITRAQVAEHANETSPWFVVDGHVYDGTAFLEGHPGGSESITLVAGEDASEDFMAIHSMDAKKQMRAYHVGKLEAGGLAVQKEESEAELHDPARPFLRVKTWKRSLLGRKTKLSHDAAIYHFTLDAPEQEVGLPIGQHVYLRLREADGKVVGEGQGTLIQRAYTPFSGNETKGELQILIKTYFPSKDGSHAGGRFTMLLESLRPGQDYVEMKGPLGHLQYRPGGVIALHGEERRVKRVAMIAGGSGITPIWSTLKGLLEDPAAAHVKIGIVDANRTEADILARTQLDEIIASSQRDIKLWHVLSGETPPAWSMGRGRITRELLATHLPAPPSGAADDEALALICGPPAMEEVVVAALKELGWPAASIVQF